MARKRVSAPCSWCAKNGVPGDGAGLFQGDDSNLIFFPTIPVCGGCGGLGVEFKSRDFKRRAKRIMKLRLQFHPTDKLNEHPPFVIMHQALKIIVDEVKQLVEVYGPGMKGSYASYLLGESTQEDIKLLEEEKDDMIRKIEGVQENESEIIKATRPAVLAFYKGNIKEGERLYKEAVRKLPKNSVIYHDFSVLLLHFRRDPNKSLLYMIRATKLKPKKAIHFMQTAGILALLGRTSEAYQYVAEARKCPDVTAFSEN